MYCSKSNLSINLHESYIQGDITHVLSFSGFRIAKIVDLGIETNFRWLINGTIYNIMLGDYIFFSSTDLRMPLLTAHRPQIRIEILSFNSIALLSSNELIECFYSNTNPVVSGKSARTLDSDFERIREELLCEDFCQTAAVKAALALFLTKLNRLCAVSSKRRSPSSVYELTGRIAVYIGEHFAEKLTLESVAREFNISTSSLSKLMRRTLDAAFPAFVRRVRVNNVIRLITIDGKNILHAATESGFTSTAGFYKAFREISGMTPSDFKNAEK